MDNRLDEMITLRPKPGTHEKLMDNIIDEWDHRKGGEIFEGCTCKYLGKQILGRRVGPIGKVMFKKDVAVYQGGVCYEHNRSVQGRSLGNTSDDDPEFMGLLDEGWRYLPLKHHLL